MKKTYNNPQIQITALVPMNVIAASAPFNLGEYNAEEGSQL